MTSAVSHSYLPARVQQHAAFDIDAQPTGLLSSHYFLLGGLASIGVWTLVFLAIYWFL